jgi:hypothetical protein
MEECDKEFFEKLKDSPFWKKTEIILIILILITVIFLGYGFITRSKLCENEKCFFDSLSECKKVYFAKEDSEYSWLYIISKEVSGDSCEVKISLLSVKQEPINSRMLQGKEMVCIVPKTRTDFPEKDISRCTGPLKEEIQDLIIQRMYDYLLTNVQEINTSFFEPLQT